MYKNFKQFITCIKVSWKKKKCLQTQDRKREIFKDLQDSKEVDNEFFTRIS